MFSFFSSGCRARALLRAMCAMALHTQLLCA
jgi:hypothetical protein